MRQQLHSLATRAAPALNLFFPPQCLVCSALVPAHGTLCPGCWNGITFITEPMCAQCGRPFEFAAGEQMVCGECMREPPQFAHARSMMRYDDASRALILKFKYQDETLMGTALAPLLKNTGATLLEHADFIVPVPLHYRRMVSRRYNQSALLAAALAKLSKRPLLVDGLKRIKPTRSQTGLTRSKRKANLRGAFRIHPRHAASLKGKTVLLVDDVYTTGTTLNSCAKALRRAGVAEILALTLARRC